MQSREAEVIRSIALIRPIQRRRKRYLALRQRVVVCITATAEIACAVALAADFVPGIEVEVGHVQHLHPLATRLRPGSIDGFRLGEQACGVKWADARSRAERGGKRVADVLPV